MHGKSEGTSTGANDKFIVFLNIYCIGRCEMFYWHWSTIAVSLSFSEVIFCHPCLFARFYDFQSIECGERYPQCHKTYYFMNFNATLPDIYQLKTSMQTEYRIPTESSCTNSCNPRTAIEMGYASLFIWDTCIISVSQSHLYWECFIKILLN